MCCGILCKLIAFALAGLGIAAIIIGAVVGFAVLPNNISDEVERQVRLEYNTGQFERWRNLEFEQQMKVYLFEIGNAPAVQNNQATPIVAQRGPYVYSLSRTKTVEGRNQAADTISYYERVQSTFNVTASAGNLENDNVLMLNSPLMSVLQSLENLNLQSTPNINTQIQEAFPTSANVFQQFSVRDFLFNGFQFCPQPNQAPQVCSGNLNFHNYFRPNLDGSVSFAVLRHRENSNDGLLEITAGMDRIQDLGLIRTWTGSDTLDDSIWGTTGNCRNIRGRDSTIFPPDVQRNLDFDIFYTDICRVMELEHVQDEDFEDIPAQRRNFSESTLTNDNDNSCFCTRQTRTPDGSTQCWPRGFTDLFTCTGAHIVLSYPHFLNASDYQNLVQGLAPNENDHGSYTILEPGTGTALKIVRRFQFNMVLRPIPGITITQGLPRALVPLFWVEETMELPQHLIDKIHDEYLASWRDVTIITWVLIGAGIIMFVASLLLKILCC